MISKMVKSKTKALYHFIKIKNEGKIVASTIRVQKRPFVPIHLTKRSSFAILKTGTFDVVEIKKNDRVCKENIY